MAEITAGRIESFVTNNQPIDKWMYEQLLFARKECRDAGVEPSPFLESYIADVTTGQLLQPGAKVGRKREFFRDLQICDCIFQIVAKRSDISATRSTERGVKRKRKPDRNSVCDIVAEATGMIEYEAVRKVWKSRPERFRG
ncbi:hypothetical protein [Shimia abyssi]|uniref:Uncharacterized protein n=1 Tax=Shimia abyssi TaxID=1662395 RepID=A0A2P8FIV3_9RHOB|nr:hypothetical protein [Shimia abyssi]PSL21637.1 hypothetical protein CLV88_10160 [Shimia abyssi]